MNRRRKRAVQTMPMKVGSDPALWRFDSLSDALAASTRIIGQLIQAGETLSEDDLVEREADGKNAYDEASPFVTGD